MPCRPRLGILVPAIIAGLPTGRAAIAADDPPPPPSASGTDLVITVAPVIWVPRATGEASLGPPGTSQPLDFTTAVDLRGQEPVFTGDLIFQIDDDLRLHVDGFHFSTTGQKVYSSPPTNWGPLSLSPGDPIATSLEITSLEFDASYVLIKAKGNEPGRNFMEVSPSLGLRWMGIKENIDQIGVGSAEGTGDWVGLLIGVNMNFGFQPKAGEGWPFHRLEIDANVGLGPALGSIGGTMSQVRAGVSLWVTDNVGIFAGFRLVDLNASDGPYSFNGGLQGVFLGAIFRF